MIHPNEAKLHQAKLYLARRNIYAVMPGNKFVYTNRDHTNVGHTIIQAAARIKATTK